MKSYYVADAMMRGAKEHIDISIVQVMNEPRKHKGQVGDMVELTVVGRSVLNETLLMGKRELPERIYG